MPSRLAALTLAALLLGQPLAANDAGAPIIAPLLSVDAKVDAFTTRLQYYVDYCRTWARPEYAVDCLSERFEFAAARLGNYGWQRDVKAQLRTAVRSLNKVTARYADPGAPPVTLRTGAGAPLAIVSSRPIKPVAPENRTRAATAAADVLEEAEFTLLRSASTSDASALAFAQVAAVLGSAKVLLRSA